MAEPLVFVSVGGTANEAQERFVRAVEDRLRAEGLSPHTVGRNSFSDEAPFKAVGSLMARCAGVVVIALERLHIEQGSEKRGGPKEQALSDVRLATAWNQIEAALGHSRGLPLLVLKQTGVRADGLLEKGFDWYVQELELDPAALSSLEFNGVLASWKAKLMAPAPAPAKALAPAINPAEMTVAQLLGALKPTQLWALLGTVGALLAGSFALGAKWIA